MGFVHADPSTAGYGLRDMIEECAFCVIMKKEIFVINLFRISARWLIV